MNSDEFQVLTFKYGHGHIYMVSIQYEFSDDFEGVYSV